MRLNLILPKVEPNQYEFPNKCPQKGCPGMRLIPRQEVRKKIVDAQHPEVTTSLGPRTVREEYHHWKADAQPGFQRVYSIVKR
jgi:hypothetical protein